MIQNTPLATRLITARAPQAPAPAAASAAKAEAKKPKAPKADKTSLKSRAVVAQMPKPVDSWWYRLKVSVMNFLCNINFPSSAIDRLTEKDAFQARPLMRPGDILVRRTEGTSGNFFIPSWWKHAAVYVGNGQVVEATFHGVQKISLKEFFENGDHVAIVRPKDTNRNDGKAIARWAEAQIGKPYDFDVDFIDPTRLTCTELAASAIRFGLGKDLVPDNFIGAKVGDNFLTENFELVYNSDEERQKTK